MAARGVGWTRYSTDTAAIAAIGRRMPDLVILDTGADSESSALARLESIQARCPAAAVVLVTQQRSEVLAVGALKAGVADYFRPPFCTEDLLTSIVRELSLSSVCTNDATPVQKGIVARLVGGSRVMEDLKAQIGRVALADSTVLITGETGTGKELAAKLIHANSARTAEPMVSINCAALPDSLVESELFGYERGAFTGAVSATRGRFELARRGTVFLDEIGDMTPFAQAKILRVIEDKKISPLGNAEPVSLDFRIIAATNRKPEFLIEEGSFRDDLFYRLNVARVHMPGLREHREDIPLLVDHCIRILNRKFNRNIRCLKKEALDLLYRYDWPGNVRELMNVLEGAYVNLPLKKIEYADLPTYFKTKLMEYQKAPSDERKRIVTALLETNWNKTTAAKKLNWSRMTLYRKMARHHIVKTRSLRMVSTGEDL